MNNFIIEIDISNDTLLGGPRAVTRTLTAPVAPAHREDDYRRAWAFFDQPAKSDVN